MFHHHLVGICLYFFPTTTHAKYSCWNVAAVLVTVPFIIPQKKQVSGGFCAQKRPQETVVEPITRLRASDALARCQGWGGWVVGRCWLG